MFGKPSVEDVEDDVTNCEENDESDDTNRKENKENNITVEDLKTRPAFPDKASAALAPKTFLADNYYHPFIIVSKFLNTLGSPKDLPCTYFDFFGEIRGCS